MSRSTFINLIFVQ